MGRPVLMGVYYILATRGDCHWTETVVIYPQRVLSSDSHLLTTFMGRPVLTTSLRVLRGLGYHRREH